MAVRKMTVSLDEGLVEQVSNRTDNVSRYVASALRWRLALDRQAEAIDSFIEEMGIAPDPIEYQKALRELGG